MSNLNARYSVLKLGVWLIVAIPFLALTACSEQTSSDAKVEIPQSQDTPVKAESIPSAAPTAPIKIVEEVADGAKLYKRCASCHLPTGEGVPGAFPPLVDRLGPLTLSESGREYLILTTLYGVGGKMDIDGTVYSGLMPAQPGMSDLKTAAVLNYIIEEFNSKMSETFVSFTKDEIEKVRANNDRLSGRKVYEKRTAAFGQEAE